MHIKVEKKVLENAIAPALYAVSTRSTVPALESLCLSASSQSGMLTITGYDLNKGLKTEIPVKVIEEGGVLINASKLFQIVRNFPDGEVSLSNDDKYIVSVSCQKSKFELSGLSETIFPTLPELRGDDTFKISQGILRKMISQVIFAVSQSEAKPVLTGVLFEIADGALTLVACDSFRLAISSEQSAVKTSENMVENFIIPGKTLIELLKLLSDDEEKELHIEFSRKHIIFAFEELTFFSRLIDGDFIDYNKTMIKTMNTSAKINLSEVIRSIERASLMIDERAKSPIKCTVGDNMFTIRCSTANGKVEDEFHADTTGPEIEIGFIHKYLLDAFKGAAISGDEEVIIEITSAFSGIVIHPVEHGDYYYIVMPVKLS